MVVERQRERMTKRVKDYLLEGALLIIGQRSLDDEFASIFIPFGLHKLDTAAPVRHRGSGNSRSGATSGGRPARP